MLLLYGVVLKFFSIVISLLIVSCNGSVESGLNAICSKNPSLDKIHQFNKPDVFSRDLIESLSSSVGVVKVNGNRECTATAIGSDLILTASHCLSHGPVNPEHHSVVFNYIEDESGEVNQKKLLEYKFSEIVAFGNHSSRYAPDAVVVRLDRELDASIEIREFSSSPAVAGQSIAILQHAGRRTMEVSTGTLRNLEKGALFYDDISTQGGSSGAAVFDLNGEIVGVHVRGGCSRSSSFRANSGISIGLLVKKLPAFRNLLLELDYVLESESKTSP